MRLDLSRMSGRAALGSLVAGLMLPISWPASATAAVAAASDLRASQRDVTFKASFTLAAEARSSDVVVRALRKQVTTLETQLKSGSGNLNRARSELAATQNEMLQRLADTDAAFAVQRDRFVRAIGSLFDSSDPVIQAALQRYAQGDVSALDDLQGRINHLSATEPARLIDQRAFATLMLDAYAKNEKTAGDAIDAYEAVVKADPEDFDAWSNLAFLYIRAGQSARAQRAAAEMERTSRDPVLQSASFMLKANAAWVGGHLEQARENYEQSVAIARAVAAMNYDTWKAAHASATEAAWEIQVGADERLAMPLSHLAEVYSALDDHPRAIRAARESVTLRDLVTQQWMRHRRDSGALSGAYSALADSLHILGDVELKAGDAQRAMTSYGQSVDAQRKSHVGSADAATFVPYFVLIPFARAAIISGHLDEAQRALDEAGAGLRREKPSEFVVGKEGEYWLQVGELALAHGAPQDARKAFSSAESALAQAISISRRGDTWRPSLAQAQTRLAELERAGVAKP